MAFAKALGARAVDIDHNDVAFSGESGSRTKSGESVGLHQKCRGFAT